MRIRAWPHAFPLLAALLAACATARVEPKGPPPPAQVEPPPSPAKVVIGAILPQSGPAVLRQYSDLVLEGVRLALAQAGPSAPELVVVDDAGDAERDAALVRDLERRGAVAIIGPLLSAGVGAAARARSDTALVLISPTASELPAGLPNVYSLNAGDVQGAEALAQYAARSGLSRVALLYPRTEEFTRQARAFAAALERAGGSVAADVPYDSGMTTFRTPLRAVAGSGARAVYVAAPERDVRQLAPQLAYYGVTGKGIDVLGAEAWTSDDVLRLVSPRYLNGVVASTPLVRTSPQVGWQEFVQLYERTYRRSLDNPFPALGWDAARLILAGLKDGRGRAADVARRLGAAAEVRGATGVFAVRGGTLVRRPFVVRIDDRKLVPLVTPEGAATGPGQSGR
ncbi:MAG: penicillin-binding protein activator [Gemmatimonadetes bacterium]|nr:penicillin-binding protein activator [Gemmatimonadota bacterium]